MFWIPRSAAILRVLGSMFYLLSIFYLSSIYLWLLSIAFVSLLSCFFPASFGSAKYSRKTSSGAVCHWYIDLPVRSSQKTTVLQAAPSSEEEVLAWTAILENIVWLTNRKPSWTSCGNPTAAPANCSPLHPGNTAWRRSIRIAPLGASWIIWILFV